MRLASPETFLQQYDEQYEKRVPFDEVLTAVYVPLYARYFTDEEMEAIVEFYESPAGVKSIEVMPNLIQEAVESSMRLIAPRAIDIAQEIINEDIAGFNQ